MTLIQLNTFKSDLKLKCNKCGSEIEIRNKLAENLAVSRGIICDNCRRGSHQPQPYKEYLKSDHWLAFRKKAIDYYGRKCYLCGTTEGQIDVHHNTYERLGFERLSDVIPLCHTHHEMYEGWAK